MRKLLIALGLLCGIAVFAEIHHNIVTLRKTEIQEKQYKKIEVSAVSKEASDKIKQHYGNYTITEAAVAADGEYKLTLKKDNVSIIATFTSAGDLVKILE